MLKLLILCEFPTLNGGEQSMLATLPGVIRAGYNPIIACPETGPLADTLRERAIEFIPYNCRDAQGTRRPLPELRNSLTKVLQYVRPDLVHANSLAMGRLSGPVSADLTIPSIGHLRDIINLNRQVILDLNRHTRLLAVSAATRNFHIAQGLGVDKSYVLHNGVDLERFRPREPTGFLHQELHLPRNAKLVAAIGQLGLRKGQEVLLEAATILGNSTPEVQFLLIGERCSEKKESYDFETKLREGASGPLSGKLHFLGVRTDMEFLFNELTILAHPARQEPLGRVLLEAAATGLPIIATDVGGTSEIFPPESDSAILIPPNNPSTLAEAMQKLLQNDEERQRLSGRARWRAVEAFDIQRATEGILNHYQAIREAN